MDPAQQPPVVPRPAPRGKLAPPHTAFEPVWSQAAQVLLRSAVLAKLVTVCAPPGYGKTALLARLHHTLLQRQAGCLWLTLDDRDASAEAVLGLLAAALQQHGPRGVTAGPAVAPMLPADPADAVERLIAHFAGQAAPTVLFIDNLHMCTDSRLAPVLERLLFDSGPALRLVLSSTVDLPVDTARAKLELSTVEIGAAHLALDQDSLRRLLLQAGLPPPEPELLLHLHSQTEGWPAAARLLQVLMSQDEAPLAVARRFDGSDHDMASVLTRRVLAGFPLRRVHFLMELALLREFCDELAVDVTGCPEAADWLAELLRRNLLVFPIDRSRRWLRMHTLLRQYLLAEGERRLPRERRQQVLERAARWHADQGDDQAALEAALAAPACTLASQLLSRVAHAMVGEAGRLAHYSACAGQILAAGATLSLDAHCWYVWSLCFSLQYERAYGALQSLDERLVGPEGAAHATNGALAARVDLLRVVIAIHLDMLDTAADGARRWLAQAAQRDPLGVATVSTGAAIAELAAGRIGTARQHMSMAAGAIQRSDSAYGRGWVSLVSACIEVTDGEPAAADRLLSQVRPELARTLGEQAAIVSTIDFVHAHALLDMGRLAAARDKALRGLAKAGAHGVNETAQHGLAACVALWDGSDDSPFAPAALDAVVRCYAPRTQRALAVQQLRRLLQLGRQEDAQEFAHRHMLTPHEAEPSAIAGTAGVPRSAELLLALEWAVAAGSGRELVQRIEAQQKLANGRQQWRELLDLHLLAVDAHLRNGDTRQAQRALALALFVAARRRLVQPLFERAARLQPLLAQTPNKEFGLVRPDELELLAQLRDAAGDPAAALSDTASSATGAGSRAPLVEPLTRRELELLQLLCSGLSNQQIADRASLSVPTVKWHFYKLYAKLQVKNRAAALAKARSLALVH